MMMMIPLTADVSTHPTDEDEDEGTFDEGKPPPTSGSMSAAAPLLLI